MAWFKNFGGYAFQVLLIFLGVGSILVFARDGFHVFLHDMFNWIVVLVETILWTILGNPAIQEALEAFLRAVQSWLNAIGFKVDLVLQPHWKHAFVLLSLAFTGYAHAFKDFGAQPVTSGFLYVNAFVSALLGGMLAGTVHLGHTGVLLWPLAAFLLFRGLKTLWRIVVIARGSKARIIAGLIAAVWMGSVVAIGAFGLRLKDTNVMGTGSPSPGLIAIAAAVAFVGLWGIIFGFGVRDMRPAQPATDAQSWFANPGRRMGLRILATLGAAAAVAGLSQAAWRMEPNTSSQIRLPGPVFSDCANCPEMVVIVAGSFKMGTTAAQVEALKAAEFWDFGLASFADELPAHLVKVSAFSLARTEVTVQQFHAFTDATGYRPSGVCWGLQKGEFGFRARINWRYPGYDQGPDHPVVCLTWWDALAYVRWLSLKTGEAYRLPSEAEWEYAARGGTRTHYYWGNDPEDACIHMNGADVSARRKFTNAITLNCNDGALYTAPVASYQPNPFGISDMTGTVFEWTQDCYGPYDIDARYFDCSTRVIRGGSWNYLPQDVRSASRDGVDPSTRSYDIGFRLARTL